MAVTADARAYFARKRGDEAPAQITETPQAFKDWVKNNADRIQRAEERGKVPYFIRDNYYIKADGTLLPLFGYKSRTEKINAFEKVAKDELRGKTFRDGITMTGRGIKEWLNQPFKGKVEKDKALFKIEEILDNSTRIDPPGLSKDLKTPIILYETNHFKSTAWIIVKEYSWGKNLYSISDNPEVLKKIYNNSSKE